MTDSYTIFAAFTLPVRKRHANFYVINTSAFLCYDDESLATITNLLERFKYSDLNHQTLIIVGPESKKSLEYPHLRVHNIKQEEFFEPTEAIKYFSNNLNQNTNLVFMFTSNNWQNLCIRFRQIGILISGGPTTTRHLYSPVQDRLKEFLECWFGKEDLKQRIRASYQSEELGLRSKTRPNFDFTSKIITDTIKDNSGDPNDWLKTPPFDTLNKSNEDNSCNTVSTNNEDCDNINNSKNRKKDPYLTPFGVNGQNRKLHTSSKNKASKTGFNLVPNRDPNWEYFEYKLPQNVFDHGSLIDATQSFYDNMWSKLSDTNQLLIQFKLRLIYGYEENISFTLRFHKNEPKRLSTLFYEFFLLKENLIKEIRSPNMGFKASHIIFKYSILHINDNVNNIILANDNADSNIYQSLEKDSLSVYLENLNCLPVSPREYNEISWQYYAFKIEDGTLTFSQLQKAINGLYDTLLDKGYNNELPSIQLKIRLGNNWYTDISFILRFPILHCNQLLYLFSRFISLKEHLIENQIDAIKATHLVFKYFFTTDTTSKKIRSKTTARLKNKKEHSSNTGIINLIGSNSHTSTIKIIKIRSVITPHYTRKFSTIKKSNTIYDINSPIVKDLLKIMMTEFMNYDTQLKIERYLKNQYFESVLGKQKSELNKNKSINYSGLTGLLTKELHEYYELILKQIKNYKSTVISTNKKDKTNNKLIQDIILSSPDEYIISIMYGRLLKIFSNNNRLNENTKSTYVYIDLGKELIDKYIFNLYLKSLNIIDPAKFRLSLRYPLSQWKEDNSELMKELNDSTLQLKVGSLLIGWLKVLKLLDNKVMILGKKEKHNVIIIGANLEKTLPKDINTVPLLHLPNRIPMIVPPKPYLRNVITGVDTLGGYLLNDIEYTDGIVLENWKLAKNSIILKDNIIYDMVNYTSSVAFKINTKVLDFILVNHKKYNLIIDPEYIHPLSVKESLRKTEKVLLESFYSKRDLEKNILGLAEIFRIVPKFYMPIRLDYRGRINVMTEYLKYQGTELAKALLLFAEGEQVNTLDNLSINYLKIFGANSFGNKIEKLSFSDRVKWIEDNLYDIINFDNGILIYKAENKLLFISFCFEYNNYLNALNNNLPYFITHLPIVLDATCNGWI
jgi:hypothetical protein